MKWETNTIDMQNEIRKIEKKKKEELNVLIIPLRDEESEPVLEGRRSSGRSNFPSAMETM